MLRAILLTALTIWQRNVALSIAMSYVAHRPMFPAAMQNRKRHCRNAVPRGIELGVQPDGKAVPKLGTAICYPSVPLLDPQQHRARLSTAGRRIEHCNPRGARRSNVERWDVGDELGAAHPSRGAVRSIPLHRRMAEASGSRKHLQTYIQLDTVRRMAVLDIESSARQS